MRDELRRVALFGSGVAELTRYRAEQLVKDLVKAGDVRREQASGMVKDLMERSKENRMEVLSIVRGEIRSQIENLGLATKRDFERLERRVARLEHAAPAPGSTPEGRKKTPAKATTAKSTAKKSTAKRATGHSE